MNRASRSVSQQYRAPLTWTAPVDRWHVHLEEDWEVYFWTRALDCTEDQLRSAVDAVGDRGEAVRKYIQAH